ncbi:MAG: septal ring lytic transglycosylase RlpA family protein [Patescibacteria group bacterium]
MQLNKLFILSILGIIIPLAQSQAADNLLFVNQQQAVIGSTWSISDNLQMIIPANGLTKAVEVQVEILPVDTAYLTYSSILASYKIKILSDEQQFKLPVEFKYTINSSIPTAIWYQVDSEWIKSKTYELNQNEITSVWQVDKPGTYQIAIMQAIEATIGITSDNYNHKVGINVPYVSFSLPEIEFDNAELIITPLTSELVPPPDNLKSFIYQYDFKGISPALLGKKLFKVTLAYSTTSYLGRDLIYYDKRLAEWRKIPSVHNIEQQSVSAWLPFTYVIIAVVENPEVYDGIASWYKWKNCDCAAARFWPKQSQLKVTNLSNNKSQIVKVNDYGPEEWTGRLVDLDSKVFAYLDKLWRGLIYVRVEPV